MFYQRININDFFTVLFSTFQLKLLSQQFLKLIEIGILILFPNSQNLKKYIFETTRTQELQSEKNLKILKTWLQV